jgi:hypothetical protein
VGTTITIARRFNGPPDSANGGYTCGRLAALIEGPASVSLRSPPPLDRALSVERRDDGVIVRDGDTVVAEGRGVELDLEVAEPVGVREAGEAARDGYERWAAKHPFATCFVCGPDRDPVDGLRIFPGPVGDGGVHASTWTPDRSLGGQDGAVAPEYVWAALDCPTSAPVANYGEGPPMVLAQLAARLEKPAEAGRPHVVVSWPLEVEGRKRHAGSALFTADGEGLAFARALWIEVRD